MTECERESAKPNLTGFFQHGQTLIGNFDFSNQGSPLSIAVTVRAAGVNQTVFLGSLYVMIRPVSVMLGMKSLNAVQTHLQQVDQQVIPVQKPGMGEDRQPPPLMDDINCLRHGNIPFRFVSRAAGSDKSLEGLVKVLYHSRSD